MMIPIWLQSLIAKIITWIVLAGGAALGLLAIFISGESKGKDKERRKQSEKVIENDKQRDRIEESVNNSSITAVDNVGNNFVRDDDNN